MPSSTQVRDDALRRLAATVPQLLSVRVETATDTATATIGQAIEHVAEALLAWHDWLVGGSAVQLRLSDGLAPTGPFRPRAGSSVDPAALASAAYDLRRCAATLQTVVDEVPGEASRATGQELTDVLRGLAEVLQDHVARVRELLPGGGGAADTLQARLSVAERVLHRRVLDTLRA